MGRVSGDTGLRAKINVFSAIIIFQLLLLLLCASTARPCYIIVKILLYLDE